MEGFPFQCEPRPAELGQCVFLCRLEENMFSKRLMSNNLCLIHIERKAGKQGPSSFFFSTFLVMCLLKHWPKLREKQR